MFPPYYPNGYDDSTLTDQNYYQKYPYPPPPPPYQIVLPNIKDASPQKKGPKNQKIN